MAGLYDARLDHMPVLAIVGQQARSAVGAHYRQEVDLKTLFKDVAGAFTGYAAVPAQVRHLTDRAVRIALGERRVTALIFPNDLQEMPMEQPERKHGFVFSGVGWSQPRVVPKEGQARGVQVDLDPGMLSIRFPSEVNLTGDVAATLDALLPMLEQKSDTRWRDKIAGWMDDWWETLHDRAMVGANPVNPQRVFTELSPKLPGNVILTSDSGSSISGWSV